MGLTNVLTSANLGLRVTQASLDVVARNIANAGAPGYTRKTLNQSDLYANGGGLGVGALSVTRSVDAFLQTQIRAATAAHAAADVRHQFLSRMDALFGAPGGANALDTVMSRFAQSLQQLTTTPESYAARDAAVADARILAQHLNQLSGEVQQLRQMAEDSIAQAVDEINNALGQLARINQQLAILPDSNASRTDLLDERDRFLGRLAEFLDIRIAEAADGSVSVMTTSGNSLLQGDPARLVFDRHGDIDARSLYDADPASRGVGTVTLIASNGYSLDLIQNGVLRHGRLGALIEMRDDILVEAQAQLDELAHALAFAFSAKAVDATAAVDGDRAGFEIDVGALQPGNAITLKFTTTPPGTQQTVTIVRVDDPSRLPLSNGHTPDPNDTVIGIDFSGGLAAAAADIAAALGGGVDVSAPGGTVLCFLDDGLADTIDIDSLSAVVTATSLQDDGLQLPLFVDSGGAAYTASLDGVTQKLGFAGRIAINAAVVADNELLVRYSTTPETALGDSARPFELMARLTERTFAFSPATGIGHAKGPYSGTAMSFAARVVDFQTAQADQAERALAAHDIVLGGLNERLHSQSGVNIDMELSQLIALQNAFAANARVMQVADQLMQLLMRL